MIDDFFSQVEIFMYRLAIAIDAMEVPVVFTGGIVIKLDPRTKRFVIYVSTYT
jgi:hypothetical protein